MNDYYHIWTIGCQMNIADSIRLEEDLTRLGWRAIDSMKQANLVILNSCIVRQNAQNKVYQQLYFLKKLKAKNKNMLIALMGCLVGIKENTQLKEQFPFVDFFLPPSNYQQLIDFLINKNYDYNKNNILDNNNEKTTALIPVILGCSHACAFCVIPYKRGPERSRTKEDILNEISNLVKHNKTKEVILLGQIIDRYGLDLKDNNTNLAQLLIDIAKIEDLHRIRFLTSHPNWINNNLIEAIIREKKICQNLEIAVQSGSNIILESMRRGYKIEQFRNLIDHIRQKLPNIAINTDIIVGFPNESEKDFEDTIRLIEDIHFDTVHLAIYSERPDTFAAKHYIDNISIEEKERRFRLLDKIQKEILTKKAAKLKDEITEVLVEDKDKKTGRWRGRNAHNKLVFFEDKNNNNANNNLIGKLINVKITWAGPFSLIGVSC